jgi:hypothetical protein
MQAGARLLINGQPVNSFAAQGLSNGANAIGIPLTADQAEIVVGGVTLVGSVAGGRFVINQALTAQRAIDQSVDYAKNAIKAGIDVPSPGSLNDLSARQWYLAQEARIPQLLDKNASFEDQARQAWALRNEFRTEARNAMTNRAGAKKISDENPNLTWEQTYRRYEYETPARTGSKRSPAQIFQAIIEASQRSRPSVNEALGIRPPGG